MLQLVGEGRTNREISRALFMSEKTASVHVTNILRKLDLQNRVQAAAVAVRLGLTPRGDEVPAAYHQDGGPEDGADHPGRARR